MDKSAKIYVTGHTGMLGSAMMDRLQSDGYTNIITRTHKELDLTRQTDVEALFETERPEYVFHIAAKTGGVQARLDSPVEMLAENAAITLNVLQSALKYNVRKLLYIASGLVYSDHAEQPLKIDSIGLHNLGTANEAYGLAKIMGIRFCQYIRKQYHRNFISCIPCNTYGPVKDGDSQFIPATIMKFAKNTDEVVIWGDGSPTREFLHRDDLADALVFLMEHYDNNAPVNIGTNEERSISEVVEIIRHISGFNGAVRYDTEKPNGAMRLFMDSTALKDLGWIPKISLEEGLRREFERYKSSIGRGNDEKGPSDK